MHTGPKALGNEATWESRRKLQPSVTIDVDEAGREGVGWIIGRFALFVTVQFHHQSVRVVLRSL